MEKSNKTQLERASEALFSISDNITNADKGNCMDRLKISQVTLWRYLNYKGTDTDKAIEILSFFKQLIAKREKALKAVA